MTTFSLDGVGHPLPWLAGIAIGTFILVLTYRGIASRTGRRAAWGLMALRGLGLALLALSLAKPTLTRRSEEVTPARLAVVVDDSRSMTLPESSAGPLSRHERAKAASAKLESACAARHGSKLTLDRYTLAGKRVDELPAPTAGRTDLASAVRLTAQRARANPLAGVVLISDGADNAGGGTFASLANVGTPVFALAFPDSGAGDRFDLAVRKPTAPAKVLAKNEVRVAVPVRKTGGAAVTARVLLKRGTQVLAEQPVALAEGDAEATVTVPWTPAEAGAFRVTAVVDSPAPEAVAQNNVDAFDIAVEGDPIRVVYLEGGLRWEARFLLELLRDDPDVALDAGVRVAAPASPGNRTDQLPPERLAKADVLILGDLSPRSLTDADFASVRAWLDGGNRALLTLGGYRGFGPEGWAASPLAALLPVTLPTAGPFQREGRFPLTPTDEGRAHPAFALTGDRAADSAMWIAQGELEGVALAASARPAATVLAVHPGVSADGKPVPVFAWQPVGAGGRSAVLLADSTWRWAREARLVGKPDTLYARFWSQTLRWLANRPDDGRKASVALSTDRPSYAAGTTVEVTARRTLKAGAARDAQTLALELTDAAGKATPVEAVASSADPDRFVARFTPPAGRFVVSATLAEAGKPVANADAEVWVESDEAELADPRASRDALEAIARATGGRAFGLEQTNELAAELSPRERRTVTTRTAELGNSPWLFAGFLAAVTAEWLLRRRMRMV